MSENNTIIIGHKNPDTDSICSALGYEALKMALGEDGVMAASVNFCSGRNADRQ